MVDCVLSRKRAPLLLCKMCESAANYEGCPSVDGWPLAFTLAHAPLELIHSASP